MGKGAMHLSVTSRWEGTAYDNLSLSKYGFIISASSMSSTGCGMQKMLNKCLKNE